jgi:hypothetical protein
MVFAGPRGAPTRFGPVDADIDSANTIYTVPLSALGLVPGQTFSFRVLAFDRYFTGHLEDSVNDMKYTVGSPRYGVPAAHVTVPAATSTAVTVTATQRRAEHGRRAAAAVPGERWQRVLRRDGRRLPGPAPAAAEADTPTKPVPVHRTGAERHLARRRRRWSWAPAASATHGPVDAILRIASVTKLLTAYATLSPSRRAPSTPTTRPAPGATVRHLLAHPRLRLRRSTPSFPRAPPHLLEHRRRAARRPPAPCAPPVPRWASTRPCCSPTPCRGVARGRARPPAAQHRRTSPPSPAGCWRRRWWRQPPWRRPRPCSFPASGRAPGGRSVQPLAWGLG